MFFSRTFIHYFNKFEYHLNVGIRKVEESDWPDVKMIYQLGIDTKIATFEISPPEDYIQWIKKIDSDNAFVFEDKNSVLGWIVLSKVSNRCAYEGVGEISIYVHPDHKQNQIGSNLYKHLEEKARESGYWTIQAQLFTENTASKTFFEKHGFRQVGVREKIGQLGNVWIDNYLYEKNFN